MNDLIYDVDNNAGIIKCTVQNCRNDFMRITDKILSQYPQNIRYFYRFIAAYRCESMIQDEYIGKSVCSKSDIFNERYGRDIARTKAIIKRESAYESTLEAIYNDIETLFDINISIGRENILEKHMDNLFEMLDSGKSLSTIKGYSENDVDYTPHCCSLCNKTFLNYTDDVDYTQHEKSWVVMKTEDNKTIEMCPACVDVINSLAN